MNQDNVDILEKLNEIEKLTRLGVMLLADDHDRQLIWATTPSGTHYELIEKKQYEYGSQSGGEDA